MIPALHLLALFLPSFRLQVLPGRTRPLNTMSGASGYLLTGYKVIGTTNFGEGALAAAVAAMPPPNPPDPALVPMDANGTVAEDKTTSMDVVGDETEQKQDQEEAERPAKKRKVA